MINIFDNLAINKQKLNLEKIKNPRRAQEIDYALWLYDTLYHLCYSYNLNSDQRKKFLLDHAIYLKPIYEMLNIGYDNDFLRASEYQPNFTVSDKVKIVEKVVEKIVYVPAGNGDRKMMTKSQLKKERQKRFPRKKGQSLRKGEHSHEQAYEHYIRTGEIIK